MKVTVIPNIIVVLGTICIGLVKEVVDLEVRGQVETYPDFIIKIGQNTEKISGDLGRLPVHQNSLKNYLLTLL